MKIKKSKRTNRKKITTVTIVILFLLISAYLGTALKLSYWPFLPQSQSSINKTTTEPVKNPKSDSQTSKDASIKDKTSDQVPQSTSMSAVITDLRQDSQNVHFSATINNPVGQGTCVLTFTNDNDRPITQQVDSTQKDGKTICGEILTPTLSFSYLGDWTATLHFYSGDQKTVVNGIVNIS